MSNPVGHRTVAERTADERRRAQELSERCRCGHLCYLHAEEPYRYRKSIAPIGTCLVEGCACTVPEKKDFAYYG